MNINIYSEKLWVWCLKCISRIGHVLFDSSDSVKFPIETVNAEECKIAINDNYIIAHLKYDKTIKFKGDNELLTGRGYYDPKISGSETSNKPGSAISKPEFYFSPGTHVDSGSKTYIVDWDGT